MLRAVSWSRSNSFWGTSQFKPPNGTLGASSEFDQPSMIALGSSRTLEVSEPVVEGLATTRELSRCRRQRTAESHFSTKHLLPCWDSLARSAFNQNPARQ